MSNQIEPTSSDHPPEPEKAASAGPRPLALEDPEKGSLRSMWELIMQLRVLLPYLTRLIPLLDRGLLKATPDLSEVQKGIEDMNGSNRSLGTLVRDQGIQLARIEEQFLGLREAGDRSQQALRGLAAELEALRRWVRALAILSIVLLALVGIVLGLLVAH